MTDTRKTPPRESEFPPGLGRPAQRALRAAGFLCLEQLTAAREAELLRLHGLGPKAVEQLRRALAARGLSLADEDRQNPPSGNEVRP